MTCKYEGCTAKELARKDEIQCVNKKKTCEYEIEDGTRPAKVDNGLTSGVEVG